MKRLILTDASVAELVTLGNAAQMYLRESKIVGYATATGHALLIRMHDKLTRQGPEQRFGFLYLATPERCPVFIASSAQASIAAATTTTSSPPRDVAVYDSVAELLATPLRSSLADKHQKPTETPNEITRECGHAESCPSIASIGSTALCTCSGGDWVLGRRGPRQLGAYDG